MLRYLDTARKPGVSAGGKYLGGGGEVEVGERGAHQRLTRHARQLVSRLQERRRLLLQEHHDCVAFVHLHQYQNAQYFLRDNECEIWY